MSNSLPVLIIACGAAVVFGVLLALVTMSIIEDWRR
jgi:hypothetical protein